MDKERYIQLKIAMPSSLRMKIDHLKRYLDAGRAAAFIGAGFSKNAEMPDSAVMKDWATLGRDFYAKLYGDSDVKQISSFSPISLASQVEACFGRYELDNLILQSLPDTATVPSKLHIDLLNLPWRDIFTTNYDTLLERARLDAVRAYTPVTNKETLLYSRHPRIVKLHGTFPNIRPFIITEEDFRTYPQKYPEFVNTVRQSLIENLFCMIGFSGDDPNFKSWLGWLRDVMGQQISPVYYITYDRNLHDALRIMNARQNIDIINLFEIPGIGGFQEGFDFLFEYLSKERKTGWTGSLSKTTYKLENVDQVRELIAEMRDIRESYPQWLVLPKDYYKNFSDVDARGTDLSQAMSLPELTGRERLQLLYEVNWRMQVSMTPIGVDWFVNAVTDIDLDSEGDKAMKIELKLSLLSYYRFKGMEEDYETLRGKLQEKQGLMNVVQQRRFIYDQCLMASSKMEYEALRKLLSSWNVSKTDFVGALWKSAMLMDAMVSSEAVNMLNDANSQLRATILASQDVTEFMRSCQIAIERALHMYSKVTGRYKKNNECDYLPVMTFFKERVQNPSRKNGKSRTHGFNVDDMQTSWHYGPSGYVKEYLYGFRYYMLCEQVGVTVGHPNYAINTSDHQLFLPNLFTYNHYFPFGVLVRSCNAKLILNVLDRRVMANISDEYANQLFDRFMPVGESYSDKNDKLVSAHVFSTALPILCRLCSRTSEDRVKKMARLLIEIHDYCGSHEVNLFNDCRKTVMHALSVDDLSEVLSFVMEQPIHILPCGDPDYYIPFSWGDKLSISHKAVQVIKDGLMNNSEVIQDAALQRAFIALQGRVDVADRTDLETAVVEWRKKATDWEEIRRSFHFVPLRADDKDNPATILKKDIEDILKLDVKNIHSSDTFRKMEWGYNYCRIAKTLFTPFDAVPLLLQFCDMVENNAAMLQEKDDDNFFGGMRSFANRAIETFTELISELDLSMVEIGIVERLSKAAKALHDYGLASLALMTYLLRYSKQLKETEVKGCLLNAVTADADFTTSIDVVRSLILLSKRKRSYQNIVTQIIDMCEYSDSDNMIYWLYGLFLLSANGALKETSRQRIERLLNHIYERDIDNANDANVFYDLRCRAAQLAGALAKEWGESETTICWRDMEPQKEYNDIRNAYQRGYEHLCMP